MSIDQVYHHNNIQLRHFRPNLHLQPKADHFEVAL